MLIDPAMRADDFVRPGHINPLRAREGGVLVRTGQTEGSVDLCRLAGLRPAAAIIEVVRPDGEMARVPDLERICAQHGLKMCSVEQIIEHRLARETLVKRVEPTYPEIALVAKVTGLVILEASVAADGSVESVRVLRSVKFLDEAAIDAVKQWRYAPLVLNGIPTPFVLSVTLNFSVKEG